MLNVRKSQAHSLIDAQFTAIGQRFNLSLIPSLAGQNLLDASLLVGNRSLPPNNLSFESLQRTSSSTHPIATIVLLIFHFWERKASKETT